MKIIVKPVQQNILDNNIYNTEINNNILKYYTLRWRTYNCLIINNIIILYREKNKHNKKIKMVTIKYPFDVGTIFNNTNTKIIVKSIIPFGLFYHFILNYNDEGKICKMRAHVLCTVVLMARLRQS